MNYLLNDKLITFRSTFPEIILTDHYAFRPYMAVQYTAYQRENYKKDVGWILSFLADSVCARQPVLFEEFVSWLKTFYFHSFYRKSNQAFLSKRFTSRYSNRFSMKLAGCGLCSG